MNLSSHFILAELTRSEVAIRKGFDNTPSVTEVESLKALCENILEPLRVHIACPIHINSGFRGPKANAAVGGASSSQHCRGEAADFEVNGMSNAALAKTIIDLNLPFDQLILEFHTPGDPNSGWVHCSYRKDGTNRGEVLTISRVNGKTSTTKGLPQEF